MDIKIASDKVNDTIYPFNPNYISDFKAYQLGISMTAVERIRAYRANGNYLLTEKDIKKITGLSDAEMERIRPYLKFPEIKKTEKTIKARVKKEINGANAEALQQVYGIGPVLAQRIIGMRKQLGGFLIKEQLGDVWGLKPKYRIGFGCILKWILSPMWSNKTSKTLLSHNFHNLPKSVLRWPAAL